MSKRTGLDSMDYERSEFERGLLASAKLDAPAPAQTERAWLAFQADAGALAPPRPVPDAPRPWSASPGAQALKWLLIGAVGGGSLVALWRPLESSAVPPPLPVAAALVVPAAEALAPLEIPVGSEPEPAPSATSAEPVGVAAATRARAAGALPRPPSAPRTAAAQHVQNGIALESRLAREVAALDAARTALAIGANARALRQIEEYHREFPGGALEADADVVAIEALAAAGDQLAVARAAQRFLELHPRDPHVARIRALEVAARAQRAAPESSRGGREPQPQ